MCGIHAGGVVATGAVVQDAHSFRDKAMVNLPGETVCANAFSVRPKNSITVLVPLGCPDPATVRLLDAFPELVFCWTTFWLNLCHAAMGTEPPVPSANLACRNGELDPTPDTNTLGAFGTATIVTGSAAKPSRMVSEMSLGQVERHAAGGADTRNAGNMRRHAVDECSACRHTTRSPSQERVSR